MKAGDMLQLVNGRRVDYICTSEWVSKMVRSCRVYVGTERTFDTDHRMLVMNIEFPKTKHDLKIQLNKSRSCGAKPIVNVQALQKDADLRQKFTESLDAALESVPTNDLNKLNEMITTTVRECMNNVCPKINPVKKKEPWEDAQLLDMVKELRACSTHEESRKKQKMIKNRRRVLKNKYYKELADNINTVANARDVEKEFALAKKYTAIKTSSKLAISNDKLKQHFEKHFDARTPILPLPPELAQPEMYPHLNDTMMVDVREDPPGESELREALRTFKNNKSAGTDKLKTEGLKYNDSQKLINALMVLLTLIWTYIQVPSTWLHASITCLFKKGVRSIAKNYRGLSIGANMSRIIAKIIMARLKESYEMHISETQFGFRRNKSTADGIFVVKTVIEKYGGHLIVVYIDLTAAYDHIPRDFLFKVLNLRTGASHLIAILHAMYKHTTASIIGMKTKFDVLVGCRQGGQESPCLFNYYFDYVLKVAASEIDKKFPEGWGIDFNYNIPHTCTIVEKVWTTGTRERLGK